MALAAFMLTVVLVFFRMLNQRISESESRVTRLIEESESRMTRLIEDSEGRVTRLIGDSEVRLTQRIDSLETRVGRIEQEVAEVKGTLNVIRDALPVRIGE